MHKDLIPHMPRYYDRYIGQVQNQPLMQAMLASSVLVDREDMAKLYALGDRVYAPGKWTIPDIVQHLIDSERIFAYRALRIARKDRTPLPGFDENAYAEAVDTTRRPLETLIAEFDLLRQSTMALFKPMDEETLLRSGLCNEQEISVLALGFVILGHQAHHVRVIRERYFPLLDPAS